MNLPRNTRLPFFAYGLFKPGQLCFFRIKDLVKITLNGKVAGYLKERDGIPLLALSGHSEIKGVLIQFEHGYEKEAYERIIGIEPDEVYYWKEIGLLDGTRANVLIGKRPDRGSSDLEHIEEWDGKDDPYFKDAIEEVEDVLRDNSKFSWDFKPLLRLQMAYALLWTSLERYAGLRYHLGKRVNEKVYQIANEEAFCKSLREHVEHPREVYGSTDLEKYTLDPNSPEKAIKYYYQVRSNAVHRGKAVGRDFDIVRNSLKELLAIFKYMLKEAWDYTDSDNHINSEQ